MGERRRKRLCPTPLKDVYRHEPEAVSAAVSAAREYGTAMKHYECRCGAWHISREPSAQRIREQSTR